MPDDGDDEPMWLQLSGALVQPPSSPPAPARAHRSHSAEWRAKFEASQELVHASKSAAKAKAPVPETPPRVRGSSWEAADEDAEPEWLASAGSVLSEPRTAVAMVTPSPGVASKPEAGQNVLRLEELEPDSFLAQLIVAAGPPGPKQV